jgi:tyrosyl-tRNA synthetase
MTSSGVSAQGTFGHILDELEWRGLVHQSTNPQGLHDHLREPRALYCGFDPTKDSLTIGNLVSICLLRRFQLMGHRPVVVVGGGTGLIGDPSGKDAERQLLDEAQIEANVEGQRPIFERLLSFEGHNAALLVNNADWIQKLTFVEILRDVGKHFAVNMMIQKDSVRTRLESREQGISYTEFSYMILQAYDFRHLFRLHGVTLEVGGSDQWGNIVAGTDLTRRTERTEVYGLTTPLLTKSDGGKFGKTESGAVWLTRKSTSPYAFYQFWINAADADLERFFKVFSFKTRAEVEALLAEHEAERDKRLAQRALAEELTVLLHGEQGLAEARAATQALFSGEVKNLSLEVLEDAFAGAPASAHDKSELAAAGKDIIDLLVEAGVAKSKREAREHVANGAVSVNGEPVGVDFKLTEAGLLHGRVAMIRRGKKTWHVTRWGVGK